MTLSPLWRRPSPAPQRTASTLVLLPGQLGGLTLYSRRSSGPLRRVGPVAELTRLLDALHERPPPRVVVLCGRRHFRELADPLLTEDDLYVVPLHWLSAIPRHDIDARATFAVRLVSAHRRAPISHLLACPQLGLPF